MPNPNLAQLILSLATTPDRAASTVGDLLEESAPPGRGPLWFRSSVIGTACFLWWRDFCSAPLGMLRLALWGVLALLALYVGCFFLSLTLVGIPLLWWLLLAVLEIAASLWVGWQVAERSNGREVPAALMVALVPAAFLGFAGRVAALFVMTAAILCRCRGLTSRRPSPRAN